ncbi:unnamed protein product [Dicrocoelium dendriticum]|nr:unnamed protein product [Dicrocoelium dendriticum]
MSALDRKLELERKKAKLAALRAQKRDLAKGDSALNGAQSALSSSDHVTNNFHLDPDEFLRTLGISVPESSPNGTADHLTSSKSASDLVNHTRAASPFRRPKLGMAPIKEINVPPKDTICYSKEVQTREQVVAQNFHAVLHSSKRLMRPDGYSITDSPRDLLGSPRFIANLEWDDEFSTGMSFEESVVDAMNRITGMEPIKPPTLLQHEEPKLIKARVMEEDESVRVLQSDRFCEFFDRASRLLERALDDQTDVFVDYTGAERDALGASQRHQLLRFGRDFYDERWSRRRCVTALDWSPTFPELLLGAYHSNEDAPHEPHGVCLIWNLKFQKTSPEYIFHCQSPLTSATLASFHPNLVIGGTYSGQIVLWDNRCAKRTPVQRTALLATAHTHPVHAVQVLGTLNAHNLISVSSDGKMCSWSLDMLSQPQQSMELTYRQTRPVPTSCLSFFRGNVNDFLVGSEDGRIYTGSRHGSQTGVIDSMEGHQAPITSVKTHTTDGPVDFSSLFVTTSFDWTVKLWSTKSQRPIYSFDETSDIVLDADWSPLHPAMFSVVDCSGKLDLWNLTEDSEVPAARVVVSQFAVNKCRFHSSGLHIAAGDRAGRIHVYELNESMVTPHADDWSLFAHTVEELRQLSVERSERDSTAPLGILGTRSSPVTAS